MNTNRPNDKFVLSSNGCNYDLFLQPINGVLVIEVKQQISLNTFERSLALEEIQKLDYIYSRIKTIEQFVSVMKTKFESNKISLHKIEDGIKMKIDEVYDIFVEIELPKLKRTDEEIEECLSRILGDFNQKFISMKNEMEANVALVQNQTAKIEELETELQEKNNLIINLNTDMEQKITLEKDNADKIKQLEEELMLKSIRINYLQSELDINITNEKDTLISHNHHVPSAISLLIPPVTPGVVPTNSLTPVVSNKKFKTNPTNLSFKADLAEISTTHKTIDGVFTAFESFKNEFLIVWDTPKYSLEVYDCKLEKVTKSIPNAHTANIFIVRHYPEAIRKRDLIITSSEDKSVKIWNADDKSNVVTIANVHKNGVYSACILTDVFEGKSYIVSSAYTENTKVWDFSGKFVRDLEEQFTYFLTWWFDSTFKKYYIVNANDKDVKVFDFATGALFNSYKSDVQVWHISAFVTESNGQTLLIESDGLGNVRVWDFYKASLMKLMKSPTNGTQLRGICLWNDQYVLASGSDCNIHLFDIKNETYVKKYSSHKSTVCTLNKIEHPKYGECLTSYATDGKVKLWTF